MNNASKKRAAEVLPPPTSTFSLTASSSSEKTSFGEAAAAEEKTSKDYYFDSYAHFGIHEEMLKDEVRTRAYMNAIEENKHLFEGKVVLDIGCGTGILSMFAARAGAKQVIGIECSSIIEQAQQIVDANGFTEKITLVKGRVEEVEIPVEKVDIIISEWMGYFLLYESMLDSVIFARDKWLVPGGMLLPDKAVLHVCAIEDEAYKAEKIDFWDDVYGFDMSVIKEIAITEPLVDLVHENAVVTTCEPILALDLLTCSKEDCDFKSSFKLIATRDDTAHALVAYFDCAFSQLDTPVAFSTSPFQRYTHWKQTVFYLKQPLALRAGEAVIGNLGCSRNAKNPRDLDIEVDVRGAVQSYRLR